MENQSTPVSLSVPMAIVLAGIIIAGAVFFSNSDSKASNIGTASAKREPSVPVTNVSGLDELRPVSSTDHIRGNPDALVKIIEYSDMECPFCKSFHKTMQQVVDEYGKSGKVAWVYRHFPLDSIHSNARSEAVAAECAGELGGNGAFWEYVDRFFAVTPSNNRTDVNIVLPQIARELGLDEARFASCRTSGRYDKHIQDELDNAIATGGTGTPWSIVVTKTGKKYPLNGAQPYAAVKQLIEIALQEK